jgi:hypothetical protein
MSQWRKRGTNHYEFSLPHDGDIEVCGGNDGGAFKMSLGMQGDEFTWTLHANNIEDAKREALRRIRRWFQCCIAEFDFELDG